MHAHKLACKHVCKHAHAHKHAQMGFANLAAMLPSNTHTEEDPEAALEARLARLREAKGATPYNQGAGAAKTDKPKSSGGCF